MIAAAGYRAGDRGPLFLERYLAAPIETYLVQGPSALPERSRLVEVGHLAATRAGAGRRLILLLGPHLAALGFQWVIGTLTQELRQLFLRLGIVPLSLAEADPALLGAEISRWGSYYDHRPVVLAGRIDVALHAFARLRVRCHEAGAGRRSQDLERGRARRRGEKRLRALLRRTGARVLATAMDNAPGLRRARRGGGEAGCVHVPLPLFFTPAQMRHACRGGRRRHAARRPAAGRAVAGAGLGEPSPSPVERCWARRDPMPVALPPGTAKITFTSGTTGTPKGVCLSGQAMRQVPSGLVATLAPLEIERHLNALPFAVLLENIAGLMAPLLRGRRCVTLPLAELGLSGSSSFDAARFHAAVRAHRPHSLILLPQMLRAWSGYLTQTRQRAPESLKLVAVGGAAVGAALIAAARALGIPAYEGYGLSEGCSVQTLNLPGAHRPGSVGRVLPHARIRVAG